MGYLSVNGPNPKENSGVNCHKVHIRSLIHQWGFSPGTTEKIYKDSVSKTEE